MFGGVGLCNLLHEQFAQQLIILVCHLHAASTLGRTMENLIRIYQLRAGLWSHVLLDTQPCPWIPDAWLSRLRETMRALNIQIQYDSCLVAPYPFSLPNFGRVNYPYPGNYPVIFFITA